MKLIDFEGKRVKIVSVNNRMFEGRIADYIYAEDNNPEIESIVMDCEKGPLSGMAVEFREEDIKVIEII